MMGTLILVELVFGALAALVVLFVAYPYRGRKAARSGRISRKVAEVASRVDPGESPPKGVLADPVRDRRMSKRFERLEQRIRRGARVLTPAGKD
jgi:hypothetical protein